MSEKEKKVYVIGTPQWHDDFVQKVFSSKEKALKYQKEEFEATKAEHPSDDYYNWEMFLEEIYEYRLDK